jgi:hypothetical protein
MVALFGRGGESVVIAAEAMGGCHLHLTAVVPDTKSPSTPRRQALAPA